MIDTSKLPYWASEYIEHIYTNAPKTYDELAESGELEKVALSIQESASTAYKRLVESYKANGSNETSAKIFANSDVMRTYICTPPDDDEVDPFDQDMTREEFIKLRDS